MQAEARRRNLSAKNVKMISPKYFKLIYNRAENKSAENKIAPIYYYCSIGLTLKITLAHWFRRSDLVSSLPFAISFSFLRFSFEALLFDDFVHCLSTTELGRLSLHFVARPNLHDIGWRWNCGCGCWLRGHRALRWITSQKWTA